MKDLFKNTRYTQEDFILAILKSQSIYATLLMLGLTPNTDNYKKFKIKVEILNINISHFPPNGHNLHRLRMLSGNKRDEYTPFRKYLSTIKCRGTQSVLITLEDLKAKWDAQRGRCIYTNWPLELRKSSNWKGKATLKHASLDRIDSSKGYIPGNIQWVCIIGNFAKNRYSEKDLIKFCKAVTVNHKDLP